MYICAFKESYRDLDGEILSSTLNSLLGIYRAAAFAAYLESCKYTNWVVCGGFVVGFYFSSCNQEARSGLYESIPVVLAQASEMMNERIYVWDCLGMLYTE